MMATYLLTKTVAHHPPVFLARSRTDLFRVISEAFRQKKKHFKTDIDHAQVITSLANLKPNTWEAGLHYFKIDGREWMLIVTENDDAFGMA